MTLYAAIGRSLKHPVFHLASSTNTKDFITFLTMIRAALIDPTKPQWLLYDQASAHTSKEAQKILNEEWNGLRQPYASCEFNSIETFFAIIKRKFRIALLTRETEIKTQEEFVD